MNISKYFVFLLFITTSFQAFSSGNVEQNTSSLDELGITARGAIGRMETTVSGPMYTGNGGSNIRLAILIPEVQGDVPSYLPLYIQGLLNNNINKFSAINLIDRQNLNRIITEQNLAASGRFSDNDFVRIGNLTNAQYFLFGTIQRLPGNRFSLQLSITESSTGVRRASSMKEGTLMQLEGRAVLLNEATAELLDQMDVQLTTVGRQTLLAGNISTVQSQAGLARGINAQSDGSDVQALFNFAQAVSFDPTQMEALSRLNNLSTTISGGTISQRILNDIQARDRWLEAFKEAARFFNDHPPFEILFDPNLIQIGETDFVRRTATLGMRITLDHSKSGFDAINALLEGLGRTGRRNEWGFSNWPLTDITPRTAGTVLFGGRQSFNCRVEVALINENGKNLGTSSINLNTEQIRFNPSNSQVIPPLSIDGIVRFPNVRAEDLTPTLNIVIVSVNGISSRNLSSSCYMRIETEDLESNTSPITSISFSSDGKQFLTSSYDGNVRLWDVITGRVIRTFSAEPDFIWVAEFSPNGKQFLTNSFDDNIRLWDFETGRLWLIRNFLPDSRFISFNHDGTQFISGGSNNSIKLWDTTTGREIRTFTSDSRSILNAKFISSNRIISSSYEGVIEIWDFDSTGIRVSRTFSGHRGAVYSLVINQNRTQFISGSADNTIKLWNISTGREIRTFSGHTDYIRSLAFSPDGTQFISGSIDNTIKLWNISTGREIRTFSGHIAEVSSVCFTSDGRYIISGSYDTTIRFWDVATGRLIKTIGNEQQYFSEM